MFFPNTDAPDICNVSEPSNIARGRSSEIFIESNESAANDEPQILSLVSKSPAANLAMSARRMVINLHHEDTENLSAEEEQIAQGVKQLKTKLAT